MSELRMKSTFAATVPVSAFNQLSDCHADRAGNEWTHYGERCGRRGLGVAKRATCMSALAETGSNWSDSASPGAVIEAHVWRSARTDCG